MKISAIQFSKLMERIIDLETEVRLLKEGRMLADFILKIKYQEFGSWYIEYVYIKEVLEVKKEGQNVAIYYASLNNELKVVRLIDCKTSISKIKDLKGHRGTFSVTTVSYSNKQASPKCRYWKLI